MGALGEGEVRRIKTPLDFESWTNGIVKDEPPKLAESKKKKKKGTWEKKRERNGERERETHTHTHTETERQIDRDDKKGHLSHF